MTSNLILETDTDIWMKNLLEPDVLVDIADETLVVISRYVPA